MPRREGRLVTLHEVADRAGVSIATVSRAPRGSDLVLATQERGHATELARRVAGFTKARSTREPSPRGWTHPRPPVCAGYEVALGLPHAAEDRAENLGLTVPGDLAPTGWDDSTAATGPSGNRGRRPRAHSTSGSPVRHRKRAAT